MPQNRLVKYHRAIPVSQLQVDPRLDAQRQFQGGWATTLKRMWDPGLMLVLIVSRRTDGHCYVLDGQHRRRVALEVEGPDLLMDRWVIEGLTPRQEVPAVAGRRPGSQGGAPVRHLPGRTRRGGGGGDAGAPGGARAIHGSTGGGGSLSRSNPLARDVVAAYNERLGPGRTLVAP
ncbi:hypothetical protein AB0G04_25350 [Actinoplanes sp. NPDC023801]|uniref:hypothetical protein n=1 Tax=Actinoplanes sp. NPDC023801 TaxID=3154595 RepID=UPI0033EE8C9A